MTKTLNKQLQELNNKYIKHEEQNVYKKIGPEIDLGKSDERINPITKKINNKEINIINDYIEKNPQNFFYRMHGGIHKKENILCECKSESEPEYNSDCDMDLIRYGGASKKPVGGKLYVKEKMSGGGNSSYDYKYSDPLKVPTEGILSNILKYIGKNITKPILKKMLGGASTQSQLSAQQKALLDATLANMDKGKQMKKTQANEKMELKDEQMLEQKLNPISKKEKARLEQLGKLTDKQKMAYLRSAKKKGVERYNKQTEEYAKKGEEDRRYRESRDWANVQKGDRQEALDERARLEREARDKAEYEASKSWFDKFGEEALGQIPEVAGLLPKPLQGPAKGLLKEGVNKMLGKGKRGAKRILSDKQKAHQAKIKMIMNKEKCSFKDALSKLKNYK